MNLGGACIDQCWNGIVVLFIYCLNMYDENFTIFDIGRVWVSNFLKVFVFLKPVGFIYHSRTFIHT